MLWNANARNYDTGAWITISAMCRTADIVIVVDNDKVDPEGTTSIDYE